MHELSLCRRILEIVQEQYVHHQKKRIKVIYIELGELMAVEKSALLFSFPIIANGTVAEHALLQIIDIPGEAWCANCQKSVKVNHYFFSCKTCEKFSLTIIRGNEFRVKAMEIE